MALGAQRGSVLKMILQEAGNLVLLGVVIGIPSAILASRLFSSMLFGLKGTDPVSMLLVIAVLSDDYTAGELHSGAAGDKVDPMIALQYE